MVVTTEGLPLSTPQLPVLLAEGLLKAAVLLRLEVMGILDSVGKVLLGHPVLGMVMGELIVDPMTELGGALIVGILQVGRDITEAALLDLGEGPVNPELDFGERQSSITTSASGIRASGRPTCWAA